MNEGQVVIVSQTNQAGTIAGKNATTACVLLANGCLWFGEFYHLRKPRDQAELDACQFDADRFEGR